ncbi:acetyl-CoA carboxylase biotin carboxyl carrier protein [Lachnospiraceae bacterium RM5]|nr:acetyl-CoA carboxylase biotin carboxyl carrier protein [Lachnospiraceae bacterium RM5]
MSSLKDYSDLFERLDLTEISVKDGDFELVMKKEKTVNSGSVGNNGSAVSVGNAESIANTVNTVNIENIKDAGTSEKNYHEIKAPLLGIFYDKNSDEPLISVGTKVKKGDVLCSIEAMKMLNDVVSDTDGVIEEICAKNGEMVEFHQTLFKIKE